MDLSFFQSLLYGLLAGITEILPVSARAHSIILLKVFGKSSSAPIAQLLIHIGIFAALYYSSHAQITRVMRARSLARVPKKRRKRPLDVKSLMDFRLWRMMIVPVILGYLAYNRVAFLESKIIFVAVFLFVNGIILYVPQFFPGCNKDSRTLSGFDGLLMGLGGAMSIFPGISGIGTAVSIGSIRGVDRSYALNISFLMCAVIMLCRVAYDIMAILSVGFGTLAFIEILKCAAAAISAFAGAIVGIRLMRMMITSSGYYLISFYCWGLALFTFILNLLA